MVLSENITQKTGVGRKRVYPYRDLAVGEYFLVAKIKGRSAASLSYKYGKLTNKRFKLRREGDGYRILRVK